MTSSQRQSKRQNDYILKLYDYGCTIEQILKETKRSLLHVNNVLYRYRDYK